MNDVIFLHKRNVGWFYSKKNNNWHIEVKAKGGETVAMEQIDVSLIQNLKEGDSFEKKVGKAKCSKADNFCKKEGREIAKNRMKIEKLTIKSIIKEVDTTRIFVTNPEGTVYTLIKYPNAKYAFIVDCFHRTEYDYFL